MKKLKLLQASPIALAVALAGTTLIAPTAANAEATGNIGVHSKYLLRGIFEENDDTAVQGGLDYAHDSGFYAGWWFSNLGYNYESDNDPDPTGTGVENDFYGGFAGEMGGVGYNVGLIQYLYINVDDSDLTELTAKLSMAGAYAGFQYLLTDGWWGNAGDIYWKAGYSMALPSDFGLAFDLGYYTYDDDDNDELGGCGGPGCVVTTDDSGFRHFNITLSHPIADTGANMYAQYTVAGDDRTGTEYDDTMVFGLTYGFGL
jgi:uncharacterized protein (TIGR02001 family)